MQRSLEMPPQPNPRRPSLPVDPLMCDGHGQPKRRGRPGRPGYAPQAPGGRPAGQACGSDGRRRGKVGAHNVFAAYAAHAIGALPLFHAHVDECRATQESAQ